jgi:hypothetical protein
MPLIVYAMKLAEKASEKRSAAEAEQEVFDNDSELDSDEAVCFALAVRCKALFG